jgi:glutamate-5-semialdehyde dehydrogenase
MTELNTQIAANEAQQATPGRGLDAMGARAKQASQKLGRASREQKDAALLVLADLLSAQSDAILEANRRDVEAGAQAGLTPALLDRLTLNPARLEGIAADLRKVADLPDPVGEVFESQVLPNGLRVHKQRVPLGVLGVIYEARPNVTIDVAGLALKTGNAAILRGGSETMQSNRALVEVIRRSLTSGGLPADAIQWIDSPDRALVGELLQMDRYIDMIIPRGGAALHEFCRQNSRIPVITGGIGICHLFVDATADQPAARRVIHNAKTQRPSVCNALDTVLVHQSVAGEFLPVLVAELSQAGVTFRADPQAVQILGGPANLPDSVQSAGPKDFDIEWLSLVLGLKVVSGLEEAMEHIGRHSTGHSDGILTQDVANADRFVAEVDSAAVYVNASTRFTDGAELGLGAEVAISTQRLHARGPMALRELTTYKWVIQGDYTVRS